MRETSLPDRELVKGAVCLLLLASSDVVAGGSGEHEIVAAATLTLTATAAALLSLLRLLEESVGCLRLFEQTQLAHVCAEFLRRGGRSVGSAVAIDRRLVCYEATCISEKLHTSKSMIK